MIGAYLIRRMLFLFSFSLLAVRPSRALLGEDLDEEPATPVPSADMTSMVYFFRSESVVAAADPFLEELQNVALSMTIPDYSGTVKTSIGKIDISITNMAITRFDLGEPQISMNPSDQSISGLMEGNALVLKFNYSVKQLSFPYISETGSGTISAEGLSITAGFKAKRVETTGNVDMQIDYVNFDVGDFDIEADGGLIASLINTIEDLFSGIINNLLSDIFSQFILEMLQPWMDRLKEHTLYYCNDDITCTDYRMTKDPLVVNEGTYVYLNGSVYNGEHPGQDPEVKYLSLPEVSTGRLLLFQLGNATFQSMFNAIQMDNYFSLHNSETKKLEPAIVTYDSIVSFYPAWKETYPSGTNGKLSITVGTAPQNEITVKGLKITVGASIKLEPENQNDKTNISGDINMTLLGDFWWRRYHYTDDEIINDEELFSIDAKLSSALIRTGTLDQKWVENVITDIYLPWFNSSLYDHPLRVFSFPGMRYQNPTISYSGNCVLVDSDFYVDV